MVGWRRLVLVASAGTAVAVSGTVLAVAVNVATGGTATWFRAAQSHPLWWTAGATACVACSGLLLWQAQRRYERSLAAVIPAVQLPEPWVVDRPDEVGEVIAALRRGDGRTIGVTTAVQGAGGFGKTTVAKIVRADSRVLRRYRGRIYWVSLGREAGRETLAGTISGLIARLDPDRPVTFTDARQAAAYLAAVLASGPRRLLILDDVWTAEQLDAFPVAGRCARLVTTRVPSLTSGTAVAVQVDQMTETQARAVLLNGLPPLPSEVVLELLTQTRRWPLLLRLVSSLLAEQARLDRDIGPVAEGLLKRLRGAGVRAVDELTGAAARPLSVDDPDQRSRAVRATIEASTGLLTADERARLTELAVFAEDEAIPLALVTDLWLATGDLDAVAARALAVRLADLALLTAAADGSATVTMHDVIRDYLRAGLGHTHLTTLHRMLLNQAARALPRAQAPGSSRTVTAWWKLPASARYLRDHLVEHLLAAGRAADAETVACDLRWADARLGWSGPAGPDADLALVATLRAARLRRLLSQAAHLLAPTDPPHSRADIFCARVSSDADWGPQAAAITAARGQPALIGKGRPPGPAETAYRRTLVSHDYEAEAISIAPDSTRLALKSRSGRARVWDTATGECLAVLTKARGTVRMATDGTWLAFTKDTKLVRVRDADSGKRRAVIKTWAYPAAVAPDGSWVATISRGRVRFWDARTGAVLLGHDSGAAPPAGHSRPAAVRGGRARLKEALIWAAANLSRKRLRYVPGTTATAVSPNGAWLAVTADNETVQLWNTSNGERRAVLTTSGDSVTAVAPDGSWLVTSGRREEAVVWDTSTREWLAVLAGSAGSVTAVAPDGSWLVTASDWEVQIWDTATWQRRAVLTGHEATVTDVAIAPDSTWLATIDNYGTVRIWDAPGPVDLHSIADPPVAGTAITEITLSPRGDWLVTIASGIPEVLDADPLRIRAVLDGDWAPTYLGGTRVTAVEPNGSWLATTSFSSTRVWATATGEELAAFTGRGVAVAPNGAWLATSSHQGTHIWDTGKWRLLAVLTGHEGAARSAAVAPNGKWLVTASDSTLAVWDTGRWEQLPVPRRLYRGGFTFARVNNVAIAPDGKWLLTIGDRIVHVWNTGNWKHLAALATEEQIGDVVSAPNGQWLLTTSGGSVQVWDTDRWKRRAVLTDDEGKITALAFTPDSKHLATVGENGTVRLWDAATASARAMTRVDTSFSDCTWHPSGRMLIAAGTAGLHPFTFRP
jgi:WD40 repeat protein